MKKLICLLLAALLLVGCGGEGESAASTKPAVPTAVLADGTALTLAPWQEAGLPTEGAWYLTADVELTEPLTVTGQLQLHLNGHTVTGAADVNFGNLITVRKGGSLWIFEEAGGAGTVLSPRSISAKPFIKHVILAEGTVNLVGGTVDASPVNVEDVTNGAGVYVPEGGLLNIMGATVIGGTVWCQSLQPTAPAVEIEDPTATTPPDQADPSLTEPTEGTEPAVSTEPTEPEEPEILELLGKGGAVYIAAGGKCVLSDGLVTTGSAGLGGNFYVEQGALLEQTGGSIESGEALFSGGNLYIAGTVKVSAGEIALGTSFNHGGNITLEGTLEMTGGTIREGRCGESGKRGANLLVNGLEAVVNISNAQILDGDGTGKENFGGNISVIGQCAREFSITDTTISGGRGHRGGNVYFGTLAKNVNPENLDFYMKNVTISDGLCSYKGDNICMDSDLKGVYVNLVMDNCTIIEENEAGESISLGAGAAVDTWATIIMNGGALEGGNVSLYKDAFFTANGTRLDEQSVGGPGNVEINP